MCHRVKVVLYRRANRAKRTVPLTRITDLARFLGTLWSPLGLVFHSVPS